MFVLLSCLIWNESAFPVEGKSAEGVLKVKIFCFRNNEDKNEDKKKDIEIKMNNFLSSIYKLEQVVQTSAAAGTNGFINSYTIITIFYRQ